MRWEGAVAVVTGASRGIGAATARALAQRGVRVGLIARNEAELKEVLATCGGGGIAVVADVTERAHVEDAVARVERELGPVGILVNNAGVGTYGPFADTPVETIERALRVNYHGTVYATKAVLPGMLERRKGNIVMIASIAGRLGAPLEAAYSATKFAIAGLAEALAFEVEPAGVRVSMIHPGPVRTDFFEARGAPYKRAFPRPVTPERVARAVVRAVERNVAEQYIPRWLRFPVAMRALAPGLYRSGTARAFRKELR